MSDAALTVNLAPSVGSFAAAEWNALGGNRNPFISHEFLTALEDSGSVGPGTGWQPAPLAIVDTAQELLAALPAYAKGHSKGEYVFDHAWADAFERAGGEYYPKLQICAPFTPANGPRLLMQDERLAPHLLKAAESLCIQSGLSSAHATFIEPDQIKFFRNGGWLMRSDIQFHWNNRSFENFDDFLGSLSSRKRKAIRKERQVAQEGVEILRLSGAELAEEYWDAFWEFYQDTGARKWGVPYLTREAFSLFGERLPSKIVLVLALLDGDPIAGALNFLGDDAIFGRYWGCKVERRFLHFELCYYQAIEIAIERGLQRVEAGAQGGHKLARGYEPVQTWSAHWVADASLNRAIAEYLERERESVAADQNYLERRTPFKRG